MSLEKVLKMDFIDAFISYKENIDFDKLTIELQEFAEFLFNNKNKNVKLYNLILKTIKDLKIGLDKNLIFDNFLIQLRRLG